MGSEMTALGSSKRLRRAVAPIVVVALIVTALPTSTSAQAERDFGRQLFGTVAGALVAAGAVFLMTLVRPAPPLQAEPNQLDFGKTQPGGASTRSVVLKNVSKQVVVVEGVSFTEPFGLGRTPQAPTEVKPGESVGFSVTFSPTKPQKAAGQLEVRTRSGEKGKPRTTKIQLRGDARGGK